MFGPRKMFRLIGSQQAGMGFIFGQLCHVYFGEADPNTVLGRKGAEAARVGERRVLGNDVVGGDRDAAILIRDLEPFRQARPVWDRAAEMILLAAETRKPR